jgi:hypothetical protein
MMQLQSLLKFEKIDRGVQEIREKQQLLEPELRRADILKLIISNFPNVWMHP